MKKTPVNRDKQNIDVQHHNIFVNNVGRQDQIRANTRLGEGNSKSEHLNVKVA